MLSLKFYFNDSFCMNELDRREQIELGRIRLDCFLFSGINLYEDSSIKCYNCSTKLILKHIFTDCSIFGYQINITANIWMSLIWSL